MSLVRRAAYDWLFTNKDYSPNPYVTEPAFFSRAGIRAEGGLSEWGGRLAEKFIDEPWRAFMEKIFERISGPPQQSLDEIFREQDERLEALKEQERADREKQQAPVAESPPPAVAPEPDAPPASAGAGSAPGFTWEDAPESPDLPKPLKAPPLKKGGAKAKTPRAKRRGKKPDDAGG